MFMHYKSGGGSSGRSLRGLGDDPFGGGGGQAGGEQAGAKDVDQSLKDAPIVKPDYAAELDPSKDAAVLKLLPAGGDSLLAAADVPTQKDDKAKAAVAALSTPAVQLAIRADTAYQYLNGLAGALGDYDKKNAKDLKSSRIKSKSLAA